MSDIVENNQLKFLISPLENDIFNTQKDKKFSDAIEYLLVDLPNIDEKFKTLRDEKNPLDVKLRVGVSVDALGLLKINLVELEYEYMKQIEKKKVIPEEEYEKDKEDKKYIFVE